MLSSLFVLGACKKDSDSGTDPEPVAESPVITSVDYPATTSKVGGTRTEGTVAFTDPNGDIVRVFVESDNPDVLGSYDKDPEVRGQTTGTFPLVYGCNPPTGFTECATGTGRITLTLQDAAGNRSAPVSFTTTVQ